MTGSRQRYSSASVWRRRHRVGDGDGPTGDDVRLLAGATGEPDFHAGFVGTDLLVGVRLRVAVVEPVEAESPVSLVLVTVTVLRGGGVQCHGLVDLDTRLGEGTPGDRVSVPVVGVREAVGEFPARFTNAPERRPDGSRTRAECVTGGDSIENSQRAHERERRPLLGIGIGSGHSRLGVRVVRSDHSSTRTSDRNGCLGSPRPVCVAHAVALASTRPVPVQGHEPPPARRLEVESVIETFTRR